MDKLPRHIAIIMDGNGRWAQARRHGRVFGHTRGVERARGVIRECTKLKIEALTLYTFSTENWQRPPLEVSFLMKLLGRYLRSETDEIVNNNIRFRAVGNTKLLPENIQKEIYRLKDLTAKNTGMFLNLALSYGSRQELTNAVQELAKKAQKNELQPEQITEEVISKHLYTFESPDPDLMIRTGGDHRISNFLLWQNAYAELWFTDKCWPDFEVVDLHTAINDFNQRERRFGKVLK